MNVTRREFMILAAATAASATGCDHTSSDPAQPSGEPPVPEKAEGATATPVAPAEAVADAGPLTTFGEDHVYDQFREQGFFVIRRDGEVYALSSVCTHRGCKVRAQADQSFLCKCHKSRFDPEGRVLNGPAPRDLPRLAIAVDTKEHVLVNLDRQVARRT